MDMEDNFNERLIKVQILLNTLVEHLIDNNVIDEQEFFTRYLDLLTDEVNELDKNKNFNSIFLSKGGDA